MWKWINELYDKRFLVFELIISMLISLIAYVIIAKLNLQAELVSLLNGSRSSLYGAITGVSGSLLGFVITGLSVLIVTGNNESMKALKTSRFYKQVFDIFFSTSRFLGLLVVISLMSLIFDRDNSPLFEVNIFLLWGLVIVGLRIFRCLWVLEKIIDIYKRSN